jgi:hypothetical protein
MIVAQSGNTIHEMVIDPGFATTFDGERIHAPKHGDYEFQKEQVLHLTEHNRRFPPEEPDSGHWPPSKTNSPTAGAMTRDVQNIGTLR